VRPADGAGETDHLVIEEPAAPDRHGAAASRARSLALYYDAWQDKHGDFSDVPLADDFHFTGPVASFHDAEGYRAMARDAGQAVTSFDVRRQFVDGNTVCSPQLLTP
jgi:hypothetical protein